MPLYYRRRSFIYFWISYTRPGRPHGDTYEEAVANGTEALESLIMAYEATGETLPEPSTYKMAV